MSNKQPFRTDNLDVYIFLLYILTFLVQQAYQNQRRKGPSTKSDQKSFSYLYAILQYFLISLAKPNTDKSLYQALYKFDVEVCHCQVIMF